MGKGLALTLRIWRQPGPDAPGKLVDYKVTGISPNMSFLEMLDMLNQDLTIKGEVPLEYDSDCREGICGSCGMVINGVAHGPVRATSACQLHMRHFHDGDTIVVEPWRAKAFPVVKDLVVDRSAFDRIMTAGGYVSVNTGSAPDANSVLISREETGRALDSAACIGCDACVAACPNASAALFVGAKVSHFTLLPQGRIEGKIRVRRMVAQMDEDQFGSCSNHGECEAVCPKEISISNIARMRSEYVKATIL